MPKKKIAYLYALPDTALPEGASVVPVTLAMPSFPAVDVLPFVIKRNQPKAVVFAGLPSLVDWYDQQLQDGDITMASLALPALSLSRSYWEQAISQLKEALSAYDEIVAPSFNPQFMNISRKYEIADWYNSGFTGFPRLGTVVQYELPKVIQKTVDKHEKNVGEAEQETEPESQKPITADD